MNKPKTSNWLIFTLILQAFYAEGQNPYLFNIKINKGLGLISNCVYDIEINKEETKLYIASDRGVSIFDGKHFTTITEKNLSNDSEIFSIERDMFNNIWCTTSNSDIFSINRFDKITSKKSLFDVDKKYYGWITSISSLKDSSVWLTSVSGDVFSFKNTLKSIKTINYLNKNDINNSNRIFSNIQKENNSVIFLTTNNGLISINKNKFNKSKVLDFLPTNAYIINKDSIICIKSDTIHKIFNKKHYKKHIRSDFDLISHFNRLGDRIFISDGNKLSSYNIINDDEKPIYSKNGIDKIYKVNNTFLANSTTEGLIIFPNFEKIHNDTSFGQIRSIFYDKYFDLFFLGLEKGKLAIIDYRGKKIIKTISELKKNLNGKIFSISKLDNESYIIDFEKNFSIYNLKRDKIINYPFGSKCHEFNEKSIFIGFSNNCFKLDRTMIASDQLHKGSNYLNIFNPRKLEIYPGKRIYSMSKINSDSILLGTNDGLILLSSKDNFKIISSRKIIPKSVRYVNRINDSLFWIFSDKNSLQILRYKNFTLYSSVKEILGNSRLQKIVNIDEHNFFIATDSGLHYISFDFEINSFFSRTFTTKDGLLSNEIYDLTFARGKWWVCTSLGLSILAADFYQPRKEAPPLPSYFAFLINGKDTSGLASRVITGRTDVRFSFGCLSLQHLGNLQFRYRLSPGLPWRYTDKFDHELSSLSFGDYRIEVQARSPNSVWSASLFFPAFEILPPVWERGWFILLGTALFFSMVIALLYNFQRISIARLQLESEMTDASLRSLRAQMKPHFLSNILNSMHYFILSERPEESGNFVQGFSRLVRHILDASDKNYSLLQGEINQLKDYLHFECRRADRLVQMEIHYQYDSDFSYTLIPTMLLQPLVENALMHGILPLKYCEGLITIRIGKVESARFREIAGEGICISDAGRLLIQVCDNGQGRLASAPLNQHRPSPSYGLRAIRDRLAWMQRKFGIHAEMIVTDRFDAAGNAAGTCITLNLPLLERLEQKAFHPGQSGKPPAWHG
jgi:hypothetical protein